MPIKILMPALSPTMTEGNLAKWHKREGDPVKPGDVIAEIETDKATMEVEAVDEGVLGKIIVPEGTQAVKVNEPIALMLAEGESPSALSQSTNGAKPAPSASPAPSLAPQPAPAAPAPTAVASTVNQMAPASRIFVSPLAKRMAAQAKLDLGPLQGSGPHGRIVKADVERALGGGGRMPAPAPAAAAPPAGAPSPRAVAAAAFPGGPAYVEFPNNNIRKVVARRLTESKQHAPHFYLTIDCEIDQLLKLRAELNAKNEKDGIKISVNDMVIKLAALALKKVPAANASFTEAAIRRYTDIDISVAVAIPDGLITPIIHKADQKGLAQISAEMKDLAARARAGKLKPEEFQGGTFSISNLGMYGIREFAAVINPPQGAILAVGAGEQRPVVKAGAIAIATVMTSTLSVDHRVVDGAVGAEYLQAFKKLVEDPISMLL
ncbi:MAG: pyruvate dehydrogenase complex dihydrolipoamide acetyltransferase [Proteobacteria bacterium]|nr:pyruvate dehydrogenase complex dihydrolipoamide acetyltransferase [Pseudomonadota bacterium]MBI3496054.1 pyruvate dehydrogenase complex dihydrolipoamide acetyltransferase [Pseudomonadota bacterium]